MTRRARLLGSPRLEGDAQRCPQPRGLKSWAVLARVALAERGIERHELAGELLPGYRANAYQRMGSRRRRSAVGGSR